MSSSLIQKHDMSNTLCHVVTPIGMLGYGFDERQITPVLSRLVHTGTPTAIILDSGSTDSGPEKLALGIMTCPRSSYLRDLVKLMKLVTTFRVPLIFSSAGGDGSDAHVQEMLDIIGEIAAKDEFSDIQLKVIAVFAGIDKSLVKDRLNKGAIAGCGKFVPQLAEEDIEQSSTIMAQLGPEPFIDAMTANPDFDIIVGGRAYDPSPYVAYAAFLHQSHSEAPIHEHKKLMFGAFTHMGKILECGGQCAKPKSAGAIGTLYTNGEFDISPIDPKACCTPLSVAAHTLYEKTRPDLLYGPGGHLDLTKSIYTQLGDDRTVRVSGSSFIFSRDEDRPYTLKLEAAKVVGYRTMYMGSIRDPILINQLDNILQLIKSYVASQHAGTSGKWELDFHIHGKNTEEVFLVGEALAESQSLATSIASTARVATIHGPYAGQKATSGNFAFGLGGKLEVEMGPCSQFSMYHLMDLDDGEEGLCAVPSSLSPDMGDGQKLRLDIRHSVSFIGSGKPLSAMEPFHLPTQQGKNGEMIDESPISSQVKGPPVEERPASTKLGDLARVLRSKNAGPYEITFDVIFDSTGVYSKVKGSGVLKPKAIADAFGLAEDKIIWCGFFDPALAFKVTIPRIRNGQVVAAGGFMENDVHGSQQYLPLFNIDVQEQLLWDLEVGSLDRGCGVS
ncbi:uncharacterized protein JN550_002975 [Neoarthrinium moseri]|uniref:uncharacterized protein n=1 Tax=Neoarthrinium moseri TaxID=1658444 RepID=UPI001FDDF463|nr:uncharacterized protein JN550_002975 [Neoarthrinium moseri]KAI1873706.1 hypothetical protein JN550_002975 [Neoarthrinium moseri]